jgi:hypothetical protein
MSGDGRRNQRQRPDNNDAGAHHHGDRDERSKRQRSIVGCGGFGHGECSHSTLADTPS